MSELQHCYDNVIADLTADDTWNEEAKQQTLSVLKTRLNELLTIWSIPDEIWNDTYDEVELPKPDEPDQE